MLNDDGPCCLPNFNNWASTLELQFPQYMNIPLKLVVYVTELKVWED